MLDFADEMEAQGADPDAVAQLRASLDDDDDDDETDAEDGDDADALPYGLWPENVEAFAVFTQCKWAFDMPSTLDGVTVIYSGIDGSEIESVCNLLGVPAERCAATLRAVRVAEAAVLPLMNERAR